MQSVSTAQKLTCIKEKTFSSALVREVTWNDDMFEKDYVNESKIKERPSLSDAQLFATSFLNWYVSGVQPSDMGSLVLGLIYSMKIEGDASVYLLVNDLISGNKALPPPGSASKLEDINYKSIEVKLAGEERTEAVTIDTAKNWYSQLFSLLNPGSNISSTTEIQSAINYLGFIAATMLRGAVKPAESLCKHIAMYTGDRFISLWGNHQVPKTVIPPHSGMALSFTNGFARFSANSKRCLAALIYSDMKAQPINSVSVSGITRAACLLSLSEVGLGIIHWLLKASEAQYIHPASLMEYLASDRFRPTTAAMIHLMENYASWDSHQYSWKWARLFNDGAFVKIGAAACPEYTFTLVWLATKLDPVMEIFDIASLARIKDQVTLNIAKIRATVISGDILKRSSDNAETTRAAMVDNALADIVTKQNQDTGSQEDSDGDIVDLRALE